MRPPPDSPAGRAGFGDFPIMRVEAIVARAFREAGARQRGRHVAGSRHAVGQRPAIAVAGALRAAQAARRDQMGGPPPQRPPRRRGGRRRRPLLEEPPPKAPEEPAEPEATKVQSGATVREVAELLGLGSAEVIPGWDEGLVGMKVGGQRRLVIPPSMAYGSSGQGDIPPSATLVFDVELMGVQ